MIDVVVEVLDARLPEASSNPMIHELRLHRQRPCLKLLNKADLADPEATAAWLDYFNKQPGVHGGGDFLPRSRATWPSCRRWRRSWRRTATTPSSRCG